MKFVVSSTTLQKQLQAISGALQSSTPLPILENFLFEITPGSLKASASDLETTMSTIIEVDSKESGKVAVPAKILIETLKTFSEMPLTFKINADNHQIEISSNAGKYKLTGLNGEEFPKLPVIDKPNTIEMPSDVLSEAINRTLFATGNDELRPVMTGVFCQFGKEGSIFVATDAHRLVRYRRQDIRSGKEASFILPKKPLGLLKSNLPNTNTQVKIDFNEANAFFSFDNVNLICRLIDGRYPNYEAVIPLDNPNRLTIDRISFLNAIRRVSIFSNKTTHQVKFRIAGSQVDISAEDVDFGNDANERLQCSYEGKDLEIAFNARFITDMLNNLYTEHVQMELSLPNRAGLLSPPKDESDPNADLLMLVMPVMMN
ncbi:MAG TPA: DNA polymerase III subunit beta [Bacteroidia bacterium]|jgi:DNA polymerase-3 subunit beta|nr:DNA polymerase III subunit beta [Bacteroidia bacterium]HQF28431.1 DNA polymerase III subunit beta [Bacteroidia bacterium]HQK98487.1 DNA polymerase III subunit beta [Bacteroidia bacterium]